jgi:hypothetical protein
MANAKSGISHTANVSGKITWLGHALTIPGGLDLALVANPGISSPLNLCTLPPPLSDSGRSKYP